MRLRDAHGRSRVTPGRLAASAARRADAAARASALRASARFGTRSLLDPSTGVTVSLTSYGARLGGVAATIESIGRGRMRPARLVLWVDGDQVGDIPPSLHRLRARGLEVLASGGRFGPHTKYWPAVRDEVAHDGLLVTADDDIMYPRSWLLDLVFEARSTPDQVVCHRAQRILLDSDGPAPYNDWRTAVDAEPTLLNLATGVSGVAYPPEFQDLVRAAGRGFEACAPRADDVWLHAIALRNGVLVRQVRTAARMFPVLPGSQAVSLLAANVLGDANDVQIRATYGAADLALLRQAAGVAAQRATAASR